MSAGAPLSSSHAPSTSLRIARERGHLRTVLADVVEVDVEQLAKRLAGVGMSRTTAGGELVVGRCHDARPNFTATVVDVCEQVLTWEDTVGQGGSAVGRPRHLFRSAPNVLGAFEPRWV